MAFLVDRNTLASTGVDITTSSVCGGYANLPDGSILINGGNSNGIDRTKVFNRETLKFQWDYPIYSTRYYATTVVIPNGYAIVLGGNDATEPDDWRIGLDFRKGGIIDPMTGDLLAKLPSLGTDIHFEARYTATYAPLMMSYENGYTVVELLIVGGSTSLDLQATANSLSYRISITLVGYREYIIGEWQIEDTLHPRILGDMTVLPNGHAVVSGGYQDGSAGYDHVKVPQLESQIYRPAAPLGSRFTNGPISTVARNYHSSVALTTDGTLFVAGSESW
ncbi:MAG: hypothetical protein WDW38_010187 [Sanguina aurantia]